MSRTYNRPTMKKISHLLVLKVTALTGLLGAASIVLSSLITALFYEGRTTEHYNFANHYVSELGEIGVSDVPYIFNGGLMIGALLLTIFMLGLAWLMRGWSGAGFALLALVTGISGFLVGVYPMSNIDPHIKAAMTFFNTAQFAMLFFTIYVFFSKHPWFSRKLAIPGFITFIFFVIFLNMPSAFNGDADLSTAMHNQFYNRPNIIPLAVFEWLIIAGLMTWIILTSIYLWRHYQESSNG